MIKVASVFSQTSTFLKIGQLVANRFTGRKASTMVKYLTRSEAINIDKHLFEECKFSVDQLMELAGQSCAIAVAKSYPLQNGKTSVLICCGPGNNGGDGLVCARHLKLFGYSPEIYYPKRTENDLYKNLLHLCKENDICIRENINQFQNLSNYLLIIDALFGFSFKPPVRPDFADIVDLMKTSKTPVFSIDIPSGWDVENGPPAEGGIKPEILMSLTAPKLCAKKFEGKRHFLGGRFVPRKVEEKYGLKLPNYPGTDLIIEL